MKTLRVFSRTICHVNGRFLPAGMRVSQGSLRVRMMMYRAALRELQSATGEELSALLPSVLDKALKVSCD